MKLLAVFFAVLAVAICDPTVKTMGLWRLLQMESELEESNLNGDDAVMLSYISYAVNMIKLNIDGVGGGEIFTQKSPKGADTWTLAELKNVLKYDNNFFNNISWDLKLELAETYNKALAKNQTDSIIVNFQAVDISTWTVSDLNEALRNPCTNPELIPYLKKAHAVLTNAIQHGHKREKTYVVTRIGLVVPNPCLQRDSSRRRDKVYPHF